MNIPPIQKKRRGSRIVQVIRNCFLPNITRMHRENWLPPSERLLLKTCWKLQTQKTWLPPRNRSSKPQSEEVSNWRHQWAGYRGQGIQINHQIVPKIYHRSCRGASNWTYSWSFHIYWWFLRTRYEPAFTNWPSQNSHSTCWIYLTKVLPILTFFGTSTEVNKKLFFHRDVSNGSTQEFFW